MMLESPSAARLQRLIPLLASTHHGEVIAARDAIGRLLQATGRDWHDLAACVAAAPVATACAPTKRTEQPRRTTSFGDLARACRDLDRGRLSPRERSFVADMVGRGFTFRPSSRQAAWIEDILARLQGKAAA